MKKTVLIIFLFLGIGSGLVFAQYLLPGGNEAKSSFEGTASSLIEDSNEVKEVVPGKPVRLSIPRLSLVDVIVEHVGMDSKGQMEVPAEDDNVAWFQLGYTPGKKGNSVLAGHFDKPTGDPAVFYNLGAMEVGDEINLEGDDGVIQTYRVTDKKAYPYDDFPTSHVFGKSDRKMLNLITCDGTWDQVAQNYSNRLVVFSELDE
jgi:LPXTG-site transpeptidase (sortase) family protein